MELLFELSLTVFLSLIFTSLFIKLSSMIPSVITEKDDQFTEETFQMDKFQWVPLKEELIKLEGWQNEGKSMVKFYNVVGVDMENNIRDIAVSDCKKVEIALEEENDNEDSSSGSEENDEGEKKMCEIEIESVEEVECEGEKDEMMGDWENIERNDFEELLAPADQNLFSCITLNSKNI